jgi:predicted RND superfamily exporter protein
MTFSSVSVVSVSGLLVQRSKIVIMAAVAVTALLVVPMLLLAPDELASTEPGGEVFDLRNEIDAKLRSSVFVTAYIAEARGGDMLRQSPLYELLLNERALLAADAAGDLTPGELDQRPFLLDAYDTDTGVTFKGILTIADAIDGWLRFVRGSSLADATDDEVKLAFAALLDNALTAPLIDHLSVLATSERREVFGTEIDYWESPAIIMAVEADNVALGGATGFRGLATDEASLNLERFARLVQAQLRGNESSYELWGLAIDQTLAAEEQGATAGAFIVLTVIAALTVVGASLRAYWPTALTAVGIGALMIWLKGLSALVGIKGGLVVELIVPIAMVSLGVDFAVHAIRRYQEERGKGLIPPNALRVGMAGVIGALLLAMLSDGIAFLSNVPSGIEAIAHFGLAAGIAVFSSFVVLGIVLPVCLMRIDQLRSQSTIRQDWPRWAQLVGGSGVTVLTGTGVILLVAVDQVIGAAVLFLTALAFIVIPAVALALKSARDDQKITPMVPQRIVEGVWVASVVGWLAGQRAIVVPLVAVLTVGAVFLALRLEASFDVKDFFSADSAIVVGLDKLDEHVGSRTGEGAIVVLKGDLASPEALRAIELFVERLADNPYVGKELDGRASVFERHLLNMVRLTTGTQPGREAVREHTGVEITDESGDGWPDTREQVVAVYAYMTEYGVPLEEQTFIYPSDVVRESLFVDPYEENGTVATLVVGIPGTREQAVIVEAKSALLADIATLEGVAGITKVGLTGSPFIRDAELTATVDNLRRSLPIATLGALLLLIFAFRSVRYAVVTVVPIGLVVAWLYAIMELVGFALNFVTATIGAVSIGVGIDYSIHMTERFREEMGRAGTRMEAIKRAASGTGVALLASAGSSVVGFAIMGFAPMPMFSTYGVLTAMMIFLALAAALVVLPSLLMLVTPERQILPRPQGEGVSAAQAAASYSGDFPLLK